MDRLPEGLRLNLAKFRQSTGIRSRMFRARQMRIGSDRHWLAEEIALDLVAAKKPEHRNLLIRFHAFRHDAQSHGAAEPDDGIDDRGGIRVVDHVGYETAVDFDPVERKCPERAERRVSGPEIVDGDADAEILDLAQRQS